MRLSKIQVDEWIQLIYLDKGHYAKSTLASVCQIIQIAISALKLLMLSEEDSYHNRQFSLQDVSRRDAEIQMQNSRREVKNLQNRLKVLSSQTKDIKCRVRQRTQKIDKYHRIRQQVSQQKEKVADSILAWKAHDPSLQAHQIARKQLEQKLKKAFQALKRQKSKQAQQIKKSSAEKQQFLNHRKLKFFQEKRAKRAEVLRKQNRVRQTLSRYSQQKRTDLHSIRQMQKSHYLHQSLQYQRQLQNLGNKQKEMIYLNSQSVNDFRVVDNHFSKIYNNKKRSRYLDLPHIKHKTEQSTTEMS